MSLITCRDAAFAYEGRTVLSELSFSVEAGDYLCIVGENGAGKSTLLKGLTGFLKPSAGRLETGDGFCLNQAGYLPQQTAAQRDFPASVWEVVLSGRLNRKGWHLLYSAADKAAAQENLRLLEAENLKNCCYRELSGGQQQRVLLARALCATAGMLILDEPATGLDPVMTKEFYRLVAQLNREQNLTVLMVSHDIRGVLPYAGKVLHLGGRQRFFGTAEEYRDTELGRRYTEGDALC